MPVRAGEPIDPDATRKRILEASERVFSTRGINAVGINEIAQATGASKATIYKNFDSKEGLVEATLDHRSRRVHQWIREGTESRAPGIDRVLGIFDLLLEWFGEEDFHGCALISAATEERLTRGVPTAMARRHLESYRGFLVAELDRAGVTDVRTLATQLLILIEGATVVGAVDQDPSAAVLARDAAERLLR